MPQSVVSDIVNECNGIGTGPYSIFNVGGVTSGQVNDKITEADAYLRKWVGNGPSDATDTLTKTTVKAFEINYASARLIMSLYGIITVDGFNYSLGGLDIQRMGSQFQTYQEFIRVHIDAAKDLRNALQTWFQMFGPDIPTGLNERGTPVTYQSVSQGRWG